MAWRRADCDKCHGPPCLRSAAASPDRTAPAYPSCCLTGEASPPALISRGGSRREQENSLNNPNTRTDSDSNGGLCCRTGRRGRRKNSARIEIRSRTGRQAMSYMSSIQGRRLSAGRRMRPNDVRGIVIAAPRRGSPAARTRRQRRRASHCTHTDPWPPPVSCASSWEASIQLLRERSVDAFTRSSSSVRAFITAVIASVCFS